MEKFHQLKHEFTIFLEFKIFKRKNSTGGVVVVVEIYFFIYNYLKLGAFFCK